VGRSRHDLLGLVLHGAGTVVGVTSEVYYDRLRKTDFEVRVVSLSIVQQLVKRYHYTHGGSNTATYRHGLFKSGAFFDDECLGVAWWIPPTKSASMATYPKNWQGCLSLTRLVVVPGVPKNACSFLLSKSMKMIDRKRWPCLVTYADESQLHNGTIYKATNWLEVGKTSPEATFVIDGRMISRKAGPHTRTRDEMESLGAEMIGRYSRIKFVHVVEV